MINPSELKTVLSNHNSMIEDIEKFERDNSELAREVTELKNTLSDELGKEQPNIKEISDRIVKQELEHQKKKFDQLRE